MSTLRIIYLVLAIAGTIIPLYYFNTWLAANDWDFGGMIDAWFINESSTGLVWDLSIAAITLAVFILAETLVRRDYWVLICIPVIAIGVSAAFPLYLFLRARAVR